MGLKILRSPNKKSVGVVTETHNSPGWDVAPTVEHSAVKVWILLHGKSICMGGGVHLQFVLFSVLTSGSQLVHQRLWYVLSCR